MARPYAQMPEVTSLIQKSEKGDAEALNKLTNLLYPELKRIALSVLGKSAPQNTLTPTALVNEVFINFFLENKGVEALDREHLLSLLARSMRWFLCNKARAKRTQKRGENPIPVSLEDVDPGAASNTVEILELNDLLNEIEKRNPRVAQVVNLRVFAGLTNEEIAEVLKTSPMTVKRDWKFAQAWIQKKKKAEDAA